MFGDEFVAQHVEDDRLAGGPVDGRAPVAAAVARRDVDGDQLGRVSRHELAHGREDVAETHAQRHRVTVAARLAPDLNSRHGTGSLGHRVNGSVHYSTVHTGSRSLPAWHQISTADTELGHWVTGSMGHLGHLSRPGHRVISLTR